MGAGSVTRFGRIWLRCREIEMCHSSVLAVPDKRTVRTPACHGIQVNRCFLLPRTIRFVFRTQDLKRMKGDAPTGGKSTLPHSHRHQSKTFIFKYITLDHPKRVCENTNTQSSLPLHRFTYACYAQCTNKKPILCIPT